MPAPLSIVYVTSRPDPKWEWAIDAICNQATFDERRHLQLIVVDGCLWDEKLNFGDMDLKDLELADPIYHNLDRRFKLEQAVNNRIETLHVPPLPNVFEGAFRLTQKNWFAAPVSRNTGFALAKHGALAFIDDLSCPGPQWLANAFHAADGGYVAAGTYSKKKKMVVNDGLLVNFEDFPAGRDSRWDHGSDAGIVNWGGHIFGCSFVIPLETGLTVDGFDQAYCGAGGEDSDFSIRLRRSGARIMLNRNLYTVESEEDHHNQSFKDQAKRDRKLVPKDRLPPAYESYVMPSKEERYFSDHVLINRVCNEARVTPVIQSNLRRIRQMYLANGHVPVTRDPAEDWRTGEPLQSL